MNTESSLQQNTAIPPKKSVNRFLIIGIIIVSFIALVGIATSLALLNSANNSSVSINTTPSIVISEPVVQLEEVISKCDTKTYKNIDYPDFSFDYDCNWSLTEILTRSSNPGKSIKSFNEYDVTLTRGKNTLSFILNGPVIDGSASCVKANYKKINDNLYRVNLSSGGELSVYSYYPNLILKGTDEFDTLISSRADNFGNTNLIGEENICYDKGNNYITRTEVISVNGAGGTVGQAYLGRIKPTLNINESDEMKKNEVLKSADEIMSSFEYETNT